MYSVHPLPHVWMHVYIEIGVDVNACSLKCMFALYALHLITKSLYNRRILRILEGLKFVCSIIRVTSVCGNEVQLYLHSWSSLGVVL
jgi:hypothetical protein